MGAIPEGDSFALVCGAGGEGREEGEGEGGGVGVGGAATGGEGARVAEFEGGEGLLFDVTASSSARSRRISTLSFLISAKRSDPAEGTEGEGSWVEERAEGEAFRSGSDAPRAAKML